MNSDDTQDAREAFAAWWHTVGQHRAEASEEDAWYVWLAASRSIPAAAALLREAGWKEPRCETCQGKKFLYRPDAPFGYRYVDCPTCNGTGARP